MTGMTRGDYGFSKLTRDDKGRLGTKRDDWND